MTADLTFPVRRDLLLSLLLGTLLLTLIHSAPLMSWPYADWTAATAETRQSLLLAGPWAAACAAWATGQLTATRSVVAPLTGSRMGVGFVVPVATRLCGAAISGWALGLIPLGLWTTSNATAGQPNLLVVMGSASMLVALTCLGLYIGTWLPLRFAVVAALIGTAFVVLAADLLGPTAAVVWSTGVVAGQEESTSVAIMRLIISVFCTACFVVASSAWLERRTIPASIAAASTLFIAALPLTFVPQSLGSTPPIVAAQNPPSACASAPAESGPIEICVHAARSDVLADVTMAAEGVFAVAGPLAETTTEVYDVNLWASPHPGRLTIQLQPQDSGWQHHVIEDLAFQLSGTARCEEQTGDIESPQQLDLADTSAGVAIWLANQAGGSGAAISQSPGAIAVNENLEALSEEQVHRLLTSHAPDLATCSAVDLTAP